MNSPVDTSEIYPCQDSKTIEKVAGFGVVLFSFLAIVYCLWILDRGFDISDEAYYVLLAMHADAVTLYISAQQWVTAGIWQITGSLTLFRAAGLFTLLFSSALLATGVYAACLRFGLVRKNKTTKIALLAGSCIAALLYASTINLSPSYNLLASAGAYCAAGLVLLATTKLNFFCKYTLYFLAGCAVSIALISKPSSGVTTLVLLFIWSVLFEEVRRHKLFSLFTITFGCTVFSTTVLLVNTTLFDALQAFNLGMDLFRMVQVEPILLRLLRYALELGGYIFATVWAFIVPISLVIIYMVTRISLFAVLASIALAVALVFGGGDAALPTLSIKNVISEGYLFGGFRRYSSQVTALFAILLMVLITRLAVWGRSKDVFVLFAGLLLLPYAVVIGTGNSIFTQVIVAFAPWGLLVAVLMFADNATKKLTVFLGLVFMFVILSQIVTSSLRPYHMPLTLFEQRKSISIGELGYVKVDDVTYEFVTDMNVAMEKCNILPSTLFFGLYNIPGVALVLQGIPPLTPWINNVHQAEFVFDRLGAVEREGAVVAIQIRGGNIAPKLPYQLRDFPVGYQYCGAGVYPFDNSYKFQRIQIWKLVVQ